MPPKPSTTQSCNTHSCNFSVSLPYNSGWGAITQVYFETPTKPTSVIISGNCDDVAKFWLNDIVVYHKSGCNCRCCDCSNNFSFQAVSAAVAGTNLVQYQCNDICGYDSGGHATVAIS